jgi:hypothetical protein
MTTKPAVFEKEPFRKRIAFPVSIVFGGWAVSTLIYNHAWRFLDPLFHRPLAVVCVVVMGASITLGAALIYPVAFFRGASLRERMAACFLTPLSWTFKEMFMMPDSYSAAEKLYYAFSPLFLGVVSLTIIEMGIAEIICRAGAERRNGAPVRRAFAPAPVIAVLAGMGAVYFFNVWGDRVGFWYLHQAFYQYLFVK